MMKRCLAGILSLAFLPALSVAAEHFTVTQDAKGVWWFQKPEGGQFLSIGINNVNWWGEPSRGPGNPNPYFDWFTSHYPNQDCGGWCDDTAHSLLNLGLTTAGAWSEEALANATAENGSWLAVSPNLHLGEDYLDQEKAWYADHSTHLMREGKAITPLSLPRFRGTTDSRIGY